MRPVFAGLYAVTPETEDDRFLARAAADAIGGGAFALQYRRKKTDAVFFRQARRLRDLCRQRGALFIINDHLAAAKTLAADGVHLGADDAPVGAARQLLGGAAIIGATCGRDPGRAAGATYAAFGALFASPTKPAARRCPASVIAQASARLRLPVVAIGGVTANNIKQVAAVADCAAVCGGLFAAANVYATAQKMRAAFFAGGRRR